MKSHKISTLVDNKGFTLMEVIVVMAIFSVLVGMGMFFSFDTYKGYLFRSEYETVVNLLQKARNQAMNNVEQSAYGVHFEDDTYTLFKGTAYDEDDDANSVFPANGNVTLSGATDVVFAQLSGETTGATLTMSDGRAVGYITINIEDNGRINW